MKILYVLHRFLPRFFSGTETYTYYLAQEMGRRGHEVRIFCADEVKKGPGCNIIGQDDAYRGLKVHRINFNRKKTPDIIRFSYANPLVADHFKSFLSSTRPDIIHITNFSNLSTAIIDPIKKLSLPAIFTATDYWCFCPKANFLAFNGSLCEAAEVKKCLLCLVRFSSLYEQVFSKLRVSPSFLTNIISLLVKMPGIKKNSLIKGIKALEERSPFILKKLKGLDLIITPTPNLQRFFLNAGFPPEKLLLSGYGFNLDGIKPHLRHFPEQPLRFGYIGILAQLKGVDILIHSFNSLASSSKPACLKIYGDDSHFPFYTKKMKKLAQNNPYITFPDPFSPDKLGEVLSEIDVLVVPSIWYENAPLIISEAFAAGVPVLGSDVPGISLLVKDEINGLLFPRGDKKALTQCLTRFLHDPDLLTRLHKNLPPIKRINAHGKELEKIYYKLIKK